MSVFRGALIRFSWLGRIQALSFVGVLVAGCDPTTSSTSIPAYTSVLSAGAAQPAAFRTIDDEFAALADEVPGFGGMFFDSNDSLVIYLKDPATLKEMRTRVSEFLGRRSKAGSVGAKEASEVVTRSRAVRGRFDFRELLTMYRSEIVPLLGLGVGVTMTDIDEQENRILVGVKDAAGMQRVRLRIASTSLPQNAVEVKIFEEPQVQAAFSGISMPRATPAFFTENLQSDLRPAVPGGAQIGVTYQGTNTESTLAFNLIPWINGQMGTNRYIVTCSHCAQPLNQMSGVGVGQPTWSAQLAVEIVDPLPFFGGAPGGWCPAQKFCRWSEAALVRYDNPAFADPGKIALPNIGSTTFSTRVPVILVDVPYVGQLVHMIGSQSGRRTGTVTHSCASVAYPGNPGLVMLCQARATYFSADGDSGSPIIALYAGNQSGGLGIHWAGNGWFSMLYQALDELYSASNGVHGVMDPVAPQ